MICALVIAIAVVLVWSWTRPRKNGTVIVTFGKRRKKRT